MNTNPLIEVDAQALQVEIDLIYASADNLAGKRIYQDSRCLLHRDAEVCLRKASDLARQAGLTLRIFDAYRPAYAQYLLWTRCRTRNTSETPALARTTRVVLQWT